MRERGHVPGFIYSMMGIPEDLFTPLFACARMPAGQRTAFEEIAAASFTSSAL